MIAKCVALVALVLALLVAGCTAETPETPASSSTSTSVSPGLPEPLPGSTPPGTRLRLGEKAVITVGLAEAPWRVGVIVTGVEKVPPEDLASLRATFPGTVNASAYFIRAVLINEDGMDNVGSYGGPGLYGDLDGGDAGQIRLLGADLVLPHCTVHSSAPQGWSAPGARFETCRIILSYPERVRLSTGSKGSIYWE